MHVPGLRHRAQSRPDFQRQVRLQVTHASAIGAAEYLAERLCSRFGMAEIPIVNLTAVLAAHVGPGAVGLAVRRLEA